MAWRDNLLEGTIDGVPFLYKKVGTGVGRRGEVHEFPGRDEPFAEDLGRAARTYAIQAFVLGPDYMLNRDALIEVIEAGGDHVFTHPYQGDFTVKIIGKVTVTESDEEGGMASFDGLVLTESGLAFPLLTISTPAQIKLLAADALGKLGDKTKFDLLGAIGDVLKSVANGIEAANSAIRKVNGKIGGALSLVDNITSALDEFSSQINTLRDQPQALMNTLTDLVDSALSLVTQFVPEAQPPGVVEEVVDLVELTRSAVSDLFGFSTEADTIPTPTSQSTIEHNGHLQTTLTTKGAALASGTAILAELELESATQAQQIVADLKGMFDEILGADLDEEVHESFAALKGAAVKHFNEVAASLPQVRTYTPPANVAALVLAYELYGDPDREADLVKRNKIRHPAFVQGGRPLEVLADG